MRTRSNTQSWRHRVVNRAACALLAVLVALTVPVRAQPSDSAPQGDRLRRLQNDMASAAKAGRYEDALKAIEELRKITPRDHLLAYNRACVLARLGRTEESMASLVEAIGLGFVDFWQMERDADLDSIRGHRDYGAIRQGWTMLLDARGEADFKSMQSAFERGYLFERDDALRLNWGSALSAEALAAARQEVERVTRWATPLLFPEANPDEPRRHPWVTVLIPTIEDFLDLSRGFQIGGYYDKDTKRLITRDIGPSLRHEFFHVLHWRHMAELGQEHPYWIMEGTASLLEDVEVDDAGAWTILPSWRTNIAKRLERGGGLTPWPRLFSMDRDRFVGERPSANYAQARAVFLYLHQQGKLSAWYGAYTQGFEDDPTGAKAMETVFDLPLKEIERRYKLWLRELPEVAEQARPGQASLGVVLDPGSGEGPVIAAPVSGTGAGQDVNDSSQGLRMKDVIVAIDDESVRTLDDLYRVVGEKEVGDEVRVKVKRGTRDLTLTVKLVPHGSIQPGV